MSPVKKVLVIGGAGFIGSHMVYWLAKQGVEVVVVDNLSSGHKNAVLAGQFVYGDIADRLLLDKVFSQNRFDAVMHFASYIQVGESVQDPGKYYQNNVVNTLNLLNAMASHGVKQFIFSSTAAIFGEPLTARIAESHPKQPVNPYGWSKLIIEQVLADYQQAYGMRSVCLRYFNAAGAEPSGILAERHDPETHLIPVLLQAAAGRRAHLQVFGRDYATPDGTCIRDYIHVQDLIQAHWLALHYLAEGGESDSFNLGSSQGYSVQQVIDAVKQVTHKPIAIVDAPRRAGDPAVLVADASKIKHKLAWQPQYTDLNLMVKHAWQACAAFA